MDFLAVSTALEIVSLHLKISFDQVPFYQIIVTFFSLIQVESGFRQVSGF